MPSKRSQFGNFPSASNDTDTENNEESSKGLGLGAILLTAGVSAIIGGLIGFFSAEESDTQAYEHAQRTVPVQPPSDCSICMDRLGSHQLEQLPCSHLFHQNCLMRWLNDFNADCPVCRCKLTRQQLMIYQQRNT